MLESNLKRAFSYSDGRSKSSLSFRSVFTYSNLDSPLLNKNGLQDPSKEETWTAKALRVFITYISYFILIFIFPISFWICVKRIHALERLVVLRLGKLRPLLGPGYCVVIPFIDKWTVIDLQPKSFIMPTHQVLTADRAIIEISVKVKYCVIKAVRYVTRLYSQDGPFQKLVQHCVLNMVSEQEQADLEKNKELLSSSIKVELNKTIVDWGLEVLQVEIPPIKVLKEGEPLHGPNAILNTLKHVTTNWIHDTSKCSSAQSHQNLTSEAYDPLSNIEDERNVQENDLVERINVWLNQEGKQNELNLPTESFELRVVKENGLHNSFYISWEDGKACATRSCTASITPKSIVIMKDRDAEDLIHGKVSLTGAYIAGKIQVK